MIKVTIKGIFDTISERKFETIEKAYEWIEFQYNVTNGAIGYTIEEVEE